MPNLPRRSWLYITIGAIALVLISVPLFLGDLVVSLLTQRPVLSESNLIVDPYITLEPTSPWGTSIPDFRHTPDSKGIPTLTTGPTGLTITQSIALPENSVPKEFHLKGQFGNLDEKSSFFITLRDSTGNTLYEQVQDPTDQFAIDITIPPTRRGFALSGVLQIELAPSFEYSNPWLELTAE